ncbi:MAG: hypothetical protein J3T61_01290 [Candidatus Brocadiales bacterium]|nr:hypothetical protein [Candidatus Bathyanammoxibius sp.]
MIKKKNALLSTEREKECLHEHGQFIGFVPNTGPFVCRMCGVRLDREVWREI